MRTVKFLCWSVLLLFGCGMTAAEPYQVMVLGDLHYDGPQYHVPGTKPRSYVGMWKKNTPALLRDAASRMDRNFPFVIQLGNLTTGDADSAAHQEQMLRDAFAAVKTIFPNHKLLVIKGNHDVRLALPTGRAELNEPAAAALLPLVAKEAGFPALKTGNYAVMQQNDLYIFADGFDEKADPVRFTEQQLKKHPQTRYVFFVTHLPVLPASYGKPYWLLPGYDKIAKLLAKRNAVILCGHTHMFSVSTYEYAGCGRITQLITTSVALSWNKPGKFLPRSKNYAEFAAAMKKKAQPYEFEKFFPAAGYREFLIYPSQCTGYTVLEITDEAVTARIHNGGETHDFVLQKRK